MHELPPDLFYSSDEDCDEFADPDARVGERDDERRVEHESELYDGRQDQDNRYVAVSIICLCTAFVIRGSCLYSKSRVHACTCA
jgi:hypothetical protein